MNTFFIIALVIMALLGVAFGIGLYLEDRFLKKDYETFAVSYHDALTRLPDHELVEHTKFLVSITGWKPTGSTKYMSMVTHSVLQKRVRRYQDSLEDRL